ncbi:hypothetical protein ALC57_00478 [Trachymyrmex cornetzi]|uniref:Uncharacterized protein n=1 Tax=Trachymyrmex cornetzi TaxID=471704 RepID=A0A151JS25_9HYME|nr:hypothetical protein ALC57_00478 [Trachymyrmex cornetzi]
MKTLSEPRDNVDMFPPDGNLHKSSYRRLGSKNEVTGISETSDMLSQIKLKDEYKPLACPRRSLFTMQSLASAEYVFLMFIFQKISQINYIQIHILKYLTQTIEIKSLNGLAGSQCLYDSYVNLYTTYVVPQKRAPKNFRS